MRNTSVSEDKNAVEEREKEGYVSPRFVEYGRLNELTQGQTGEGDDGLGGTVPPTR